ncbi:MAG: hypothetical protein WC222_05730 [Parachlamydiales bacterium]|jgi:hypothetical protein
MGIALSNLPPKFNQHLLGHSECKAPVGLKEEIDQVFQDFLCNSCSIEEKNNIRECVNSIIKGPREDDDTFTTPDTHLYRVRKALKIQKYISENGLNDVMEVPEKYIYYHSQEDKLYVISKKIELSNEIASINSPHREEILKKSERMGQVQALREGKPKRDFTPIQARALAELASLGYTDLNYNNLFFTKDGKVAILDTEPFTRACKKSLCDGLMGYFIDKTALIAQQAIEGTARLKLFCKNSKALEAVVMVERNNALWSMAKLTAKIILISLFVFYALPAFSGTSLAMNSILTAAKILLFIKTLVLFNNLFSIGLAWNFSIKGDMYRLNKLDDTALLISEIYREIVSCI